MAVPSRPVIGICTPLETAAWGLWRERAALVPFTYVTAVQSAGGIALLGVQRELAVRSARGCGR